MWNGIGFVQSTISRSSNGSSTFVLMDCKGLVQTWLIFGFDGSLVFHQRQKGHDWSFAGSLSHNLTPQPCWTPFKHGPSDCGRDSLSAHVLQHVAGCELSLNGWKTFHIVLSENPFELGHSSCLDGADPVGQSNGVMHGTQSTSSTSRVQLIRSIGK